MSAEPSLPSEDGLEVEGAEERASAFERFYRERWTPTVRLARMIVDSQGEAEEIAQEAFIRLHDRWSILERPDGFLHTVTVNLCRSIVRRRSMERRRNHGGLQDVVHEPEIDETWLALARLPFRQRAVLALAYYEDLPEAAIADILGCRIGTVKSARHRALRTLKKELS